MQLGSDSDSSEYETDTDESDEDDFARSIRLKPVFVSKLSVLCCVWACFVTKILCVCGFCLNLSLSVSHSVVDTCFSLMGGVSLGGGGSQGGT